MTFLEYSKNLLKETGYRLTVTRLEVLNVLEESRFSLNPYQIAETINSAGKKIDVVTVYRILEKFEEIGLVHKSRDGYSRCQELECANHQHCHHQFVCKECKKVEELHLEDDLFLEDINKKFANLLINSHNFEFFGLCGECR